MRKLLVVAGAMVTVIAFGPRAHAYTTAFEFSGGGFSGSGFLTVEPNVSPPDPNPNCGKAGENPCRSDPPGAYRVTDITGTFSDAKDGISNANITGLVPINPANERDPTFDGLVPSSLSFIDYGPNTADHWTYNNLFFPDGSPIDCVYLYKGTFLDVYGVEFTIAGGDMVNLWGDGDRPGLGLTYGIGVTDGYQKLGNQFAGISASVPEPSSFWRFGTSLLVGLAWRRGSTTSRARLA